MDRKALASRVQYLLILPILALAAYFVMRTVGGVFEGMYDFTLMRAGHDLLVGLNPYRHDIPPSEAPFLYPPWVAMASVPFSALSPLGARAVWYLISLAFVLAGCYLTLRLNKTGDRRSSFAALATLMLVALMFYPVWTNARLGQISGVIFGLFAGSLMALKARRVLLGGILLGTASAIKFVPLLFIAYALLRGERKFALTAACTFAGLQLLPALFFPSLFLHYWAVVFPGIAHLTAAINISLASIVGFLAHESSGPAVWTARIVSAGLLAYPFLRRRGEKELSTYAVSLLAAASAVFGPLVENHHMIWLFLPIWFLLKRVVERSDKFGFVVWSFVMLLLSQPYRLARLVEDHTGLRLPAGIDGGAFLQLGAVLLYAALLVLSREDREPIPNNAIQ